jgi:hypothetical protein
MNTKHKQDQKNQRQETRQRQGPKKQGPNPKMLNDLKQHDQEHPETRLTR